MGEPRFSAQHRTAARGTALGVLREDHWADAAQRHSGAPAHRLPAALMTIDEAAAVLNVPRSWLRDKVTDRQVPHCRLGRHVRFAAEHLELIITSSEAPVGRAGVPTGARHLRRPAMTVDEPPRPEPPSAA